jgi:hypothetical protein
MLEISTGNNNTKINLHYQAEVLGEITIKNLGIVS